MQFLKLPLLLSALAATTLAAHAQNTPTQTRLPSASSAAAIIARQGVSGANSTSTRIYSGRDNRGRDYRGRGDRDRDRNDRDRDDRNRDNRGRGKGSNHYYVPTTPYYPYPAYNNYYYPALPSTSELTPRPYNWSIPSTITNIPLGNYYNSYPGYPAPTYGNPAPAYGYPAPAYGYPAPPYGYPAYGGVPYPNYGNSTYIYGSGNGSIYSQSQNSGYGLSIGNGGVSVRLGNNKSTSSTTVRSY